MNSNRSSLTVRKASRHGHNKLNIRNTRVFLHIFGLPKVSVAERCDDSPGGRPCVVMAREC